MGIKQMYDIIETGYDFVEEQHTNVGVTAVDLTTRLFYEDGISIRHEGGSTLSEADYTLTDLDQPLTNLFGKNVYKKLFVTNNLYQAGVLFITYTGIGDYLAATDVGELQTQIDSKFDATVGGPIESDITVRDILPNMTGATGEVSTRNIGSPTAKFNSVYADEVFVGASSLYVNGKKAIEDNSDTMTFSTDTDQGLQVKTVSSAPGSGNGNLTLQSDNEIGMVGKGGVEVTVPVGVANKDLVISNASTNGRVQISAVDAVTLSGSSVDVTGTLNAADMVLSGDLTIQGTTTTLDTQTVTMEDNIIELNRNQTGTPASTLVSGITVNRGDSADYRFVFVEATDTFRVGEIGFEQSVATRQDAPVDAGIAFWDDTTHKFNTFSGLTYDGANLATSGTLGVGGAISAASSITVKGVVVSAQGTNIEGGEIMLAGAGTHDDVKIDNNAGNFRVFKPNMTFLQVSGDGTGISVPHGDLYVQSRRVVTVASGTTFPIDAGLGDECYRTDLDEWYKYNGATWLQI